MQTFILVSSILLWFVVLMNLGLSLALVRKVNKGPAVTKMDMPSGLPPGDTAPAFSAQTLNGDTVTLDHYLGKELIMMFIAPSCDSCEKALPRLNALYSAIRATGAELVLVNNERDLDNARELVNRFALGVPLLLAPRAENTLWLNYQVMGTPFFYRIDSQGKVLASGFPSWRTGVWKDLVDAWESPSTIAAAPALANA